MIEDSRASTCCQMVAGRGQSSNDVSTWAGSVYLAQGNIGRRGYIWRISRWRSVTPHWSILHRIRITNSSLLRGISVWNDWVSIISQHFDIHILFLYTNCRGYYTLSISLCMIDWKSLLKFFVRWDISIEITEYNIGGNSCSRGSGVCKIVFCLWIISKQYCVHFFLIRKHIYKKTMQLFNNFWSVCFSIRIVSLVFAINHKSMSFHMF